MNMPIVPRPSVPSGPAIPDSGSGPGNGGAEGAKNPWKRSGCHTITTTLTLACYNARTLRKDDRLQALLYEMDTIKWGILGLSEVKRRGEDLIRLNSGDLFYYNGPKDITYGGVGFLVKKEITPDIQNIKSISTRVCFLTLKLNKRYSLKIIQVYAPTSSHPNAEVDVFYDDIEKALEDNPCHFTTIIGDFNAKIGPPLLNEKSVGNFGLGVRNDRGQTLVNFLEQKHLFAMNTFFQKRPTRKWTWVSPGGKTKNEIEYIVSSHKYTVQDVTVLSHFKTGSDHRMVRATLKFDLRKERTKLISGQRRYEAQELALLGDQFQIDLKNQFEGLKELNLDADHINKKLCDVIVDTSKKHLGRVNRKKSKLSVETQNMIEERRNMNHNTVPDHKQIISANKKINKAIKKDLRKYNTDIVINTIKRFRGPKVFQRKLKIGSKQIMKLEDKNGNLVTDRQKMLTVVEEFYGDLYATRSIKPNIPGDDPRAPAVENRNIEELPQILPCEIQKAISQMKSEKSPGQDGITIEMLRAGGQPLLTVLVQLFNEVLLSAHTPESWKNAVVTIIHKKGDIGRLSNYRPISLLSQIYKLFSKVLCNRLTRQLDECQPVEQAGFRSGFSTIDHIHTVKQLMEKSQEFDQPLCMAFVDYEKAFDSVEHWAVFDSLHRCSIDARYVDVLRELYASAEMKVKLHDLSNPIPIKRGVRQGDTISPKLFTAVLEDVIKMLAWDSFGINVNGVFLSHLRFADDLVLFAENLDDLQHMVQELSDASLKVGLKINMTKTKVMSNVSGTSNPIMIGNEILETVDSYVYLGHTLSFGIEHQKKEVSRRIQLGWAAFKKLDDILKSRHIPQCLKTRLFNQCVLPTMTYGAETWTLTHEAVHKIRVAQRAMERSMLGIKLQDRVRNTEIRRRTKVRDVGIAVMKLKWSWAGHVARRSDDRWSKVLTEWWPRQGRRSVGRPAARWVDDIITIAGRTWTRLAQDRGRWHSKREAYTQQWDKEGCG